MFNQFVSSSGYFCEGAGTAFMPYLLSTLDTLAWRYNVPEMVYPEALIPGLREVGARTTLNLWGNVYPRGGFLHQTDDHKAGAVVAQRAGDVVTRRGQIHVYQPLLANSRDGYWPAGALMEGDASTGKWQELTPSPVPVLHGLPAQRLPDPGPARRLRLGAVAAVCVLRTPGPGVPRQCRFLSEGTAMKRPGTDEPLRQGTSPAAPGGAGRGARSGLRPPAWAQTGFQTSGPILGDEVMYSIGGGSAVSMGRAAGMRSIGVGVGWNSNLICGDMSIQTTLRNQLNGITNGFQQIMSNVIQSATSAVASLPALIIQRADPGLYNLLTNGVLQARMDFDRSKLTCRAMAERMADAAGGSLAGARSPKAWPCAMQCRARMRSRPSSKPRRAAAIDRRAVGRGQQRGRLRPARDQGRRRCHPRRLQPGERSRRDGHVFHRLRQLREPVLPDLDLTAAGGGMGDAGTRGAATAYLRCLHQDRDGARRRADAADPGGIRNEAGSPAGTDLGHAHHDVREPAHSRQHVGPSRAASSRRCATSRTRTCWRVVWHRRSRCRGTGEGLAAPADPADRQEGTQRGSRTSLRWRQ